MRVSLKTILFLFPALLLTSCDAMLFMTYSVENKSDEEITIFVPNYPTDSTLYRLGYGRRTDTTITLKPGEKTTVGMGDKIDFPWATKNIYRNHPGICGIKIYRADSIENAGCTRSEWKYRRRNSSLKLK